MDAGEAELEARGCLWRLFCDYPGDMEKTDPVSEDGEKRPGRLSVELELDHEGARSLMAFSHGEFDPVLSKKQKSRSLEGGTRPPWKKGR